MPAPHVRWVARAVLFGSLAATAFYFARGRFAVAAACAALALVCVAALLPRGRRGYFAVAAIAASTLLTIGLVLGLDVYLHHRFARTGGYNVWGYRGDTIGRKAPGELRLVMLGGSVAFGFGVEADQTIPYYLERRLSSGQHAPRVVNLGWNSEGAYSFLPTLEDYDYLEYDGAILYSGYNDLGRNTQVFRHQSAVFRLTGYLPILPIVPIRRWLEVNDLNDTASADGKVVFRPTLADRYATEAADTALRITKALEHELGRLAAEQPESQPTGVDGIEAEWVDYCGYVERAVRYTIDRGRTAFVVTEPYRDARHIRQQFAVWKMLRSRFAGHPKVHYIDLGGAVDLDDRTLSYDGLHLTPAGNERVAARLADALRKAIAGD
jgi:hypothetical protein